MKWWHSSPPFLSFFFFLLLVLWYSNFYYQHHCYCCCCNYYNYSYYSSCCCQFSVFLFFLATSVFPAFYPFRILICSVILMLIDWLIDWLTDWLTDLLIDQLTFIQSVNSATKTFTTTVHLLWKLSVLNVPDVELLQHVSICPFVEPRWFELVNKSRDAASPVSSRPSDNV